MLGKLSNLSTCASSRKESIALC